MKWLKRKQPTINTDDTNDDLFGFDGVPTQDLSDKWKKDIVLSSLDTITKKKDKSVKVNDKNLKELCESVKDFKHNNFNQTGNKQTDFNFLENSDIEVIQTIKGTKNGLSKSNGKITQDQIEILKKCKEESSATELRKISKRTNKTKFKKGVLDPLIDFGFFELAIPDAPKSPNQKYILTGKFIRRIQKK